jgi:hypothetical protein
MFQYSKKKNGENVQILYVIFHCDVILYRFWKVSVIIPKKLIFYIKLQRTFWNESKNFDMKVEQWSYIKFCEELGSDYRLIKANGPVRKNYPEGFRLSWHKRFTNEVLNKSESKVLDGSQLSQKN